MHEFRITIFHGPQRIERRIIATNSIEATMTGLMMSPEAKGPLTVFCKPIQEIVKWQPSTAA